MPNSSSAGIPWFLNIYRKLVDEVEHLGVYLSYNSAIDQNWSIVTAYELQLLSSDPSVCDDVVRIEKNREFKWSYSASGWGWPKFITVDKLRAGSFIQNDTIKIKGHLSSKSFERIYQ